MTPALLDAQALHVGYGGKPVLLDVSIAGCARREVLCLIGHNGAGKSTLRAHAVRAGEADVRDGSRSTAHAPIRTCRVLAASGRRPDARGPRRVSEPDRRGDLEPRPGLGEVAAGRRRARIEWVLSCFRR